MMRVNQHWASGNRFDIHTRQGRATVCAYRNTARDSGPGSNWYVVQVISGMESMVVQAMQKAGLNVWLPTRKERRTCQMRRAGGGTKPKMRDVEVAAFPGYLFLRTVPCAQAWHGIISFDGVISILGEGDHPVLMSDSQMQELVQFIDRRVLDFSTGRNRFVAGDVVEFTNGQMAQHKGIVDETYGGTGIVPVLVDMFGRKTIVMVSVDMIAKYD